MIYAIHAVLMEKEHVMKVPEYQYRHYLSIIIFVQSVIYHL